MGGIIHIGANTGQEASGYYPRNVIWIEPIPRIFKKLMKNISKFSNQIAFNELVTDKDGECFNFFISNNKDNASSSIMEPKLHKVLYPDVEFKETINIKSKTLQTVLYENNVRIDDYDTIVLDTQGSELMILKSSIDIVKKMKTVITEVANFESYKNCCNIEDLDNFFSGINFKRIKLKRQSGKKDMKYYVATYVKEVNAND